MKKINVEATKLNNEDVIATSSACAGKYHLKVDYVDYTGDKEICYLYKDDGNGVLVYQNPSDKPSELVSDANGDWSSERYYVNLDGAQIGYLYYWNNGTWIKCDEKHPK